MNPLTLRKVPFAALQESNSFDQQVSLAVRLRVEKLISELIPAENTEYYVHGEGFVFQREDASTGVGEFEYHQNAQGISHDSIISNDLRSFLIFMGTLSQEFADQLKQLMYERAGEEAEAVGNSVNAQEIGSLADAYLEAYRKLEFGVDKEGKVSLPEFHLSPDMAQRLRSELEQQKREFFQEMEDLIQQKTFAALEKEQVRLSKFKR